MLGIASAISIALQAYLIVGLIFGIWFAFRMTRNEPISTFFTRLILVPGAMLLWPYLLFRGGRS